MGLTAEMFGEYAVRLAERRLGDDDLEPVGRLGRFASLRRGWEIACGECFEEKALDLAGEPSFVRGELLEHLGAPAQDVGGACFDEAPYCTGLSGASNVADLDENLGG